MLIKFLLDDTGRFWSNGLRAMLPTRDADIMMAQLGKMSCLLLHIRACNW